MVEINNEYTTTGNDKREYTTLIRLSIESLDAATKADFMNRLEAEIQRLDLSLKQNPNSPFETQGTLESLRIWFDAFQEA